MEQSQQIAEMAVIGGMMIDSSALYKVTGQLNSNDFEDERNQIIFDAIIILLQKGLEVNLVSVAEQLQLLKKLKYICGQQYLVDCTYQIPLTSDVQEYINIVKDKSLARRFFGLLKNLENEYETKEIEDLSEFIGAAEKSILEITKQRRVSEFLASKDIINVLVERLDNERAERERNIGKRPSYLTGTPTGYEDMDRKIGGFQKGSLIILAARPSVGKTALALNFAAKAAHCGVPVGIFSLEMSSEQIMLRLASEKAHLSTGDILQLPLKHGTTYFDTNFPTEREEQTKIASLNSALDILANDPIFIDDYGGNKLMDIQAKARKLKNSHPDLGLIVIDYIGLINSSGKNYKGDRQQEIAEYSRSLKQLAKELEVPILCLCQLSRNVEQRTNHRPALSDLRDSGAIEQDADQVFFIYREDYYNNNKDDKAQGNNQSDIPPEPPIEGEEPNGQSAPSSGNSMVELILAKNRSGELATFKFMFMKQFCRFESIYDGDDYQG